MRNIKRILLILLAVMMTLTACGKSEESSQLPDPMETEESSETVEPFVLDREYITNALLDCMKSETIQSAMAESEKMTSMVSDFTIIEALEVLVDDIGAERNNLHLLMLRIGCGVKVEDNPDPYFIACLDYDNGDFYDSVTLYGMTQAEKDAAPVEKTRIIQEAVEMGYFKNSNYAGEMLFIESEVRNPYPESEIAKINTVLREEREAQIAQQQAEQMAQVQAELQYDPETVTQLVKGFLQGEEYLIAAAKYKEITGDDPEFVVDSGMVLRAENMGVSMITLRFLMLHIDGGFALENGDMYERFALVYDMDTGILYDTITVDDSMSAQGEKDEFIYMAVKSGCFPWEGYTGNPIFTDSEIQQPLSQDELDEINR